MTSGDEHLDFGRVDVLRVTVAVGPTLDTTPDEVFVLDLDDPHPEGSRWDETPYVDALEAMLRRVGTPPPPHAMEVARLHATWPTRLATARIVLSLGVGARTPRPPLGAAVLAAFETMLANPEGQPALPRDDALSLSRRLVHSAWPEVGVGTLTVTDEEHHHASGLWRVGLCSPARTRFEVDLGVLGGDPSTAHLRRTPAAEVVDSVGV